MLLVSLLLCAAPAPQLTLPTRPVTGPIVDLGVFDYATRTFSPTATVGPDVLYDNTAESGAYVDMVALMAAAGGVRRLTDTGGVPGPSNPGPFAGIADRDDLFVNGLEVAYCDQNPGATVTLLISIEDGLAPCSRATTRNGYIVLESLPGGGCYRLQVDFSNLPFCMRPDGGTESPGFDGTIARDTFSFSVAIYSTGPGPYGPLLAGDPESTDASYAPPMSATPRDGSGTYYGLPGVCPTGNTGYLSSDVLLVESSTSQSAQCYDAGGYANTGVCGAVGANPWASLHFRLFTDPAESCDLDCSNGTGPFQIYCVSNPNSTGVEGKLRLCGHSSVDVNDMQLTAYDLPRNSFGYFVWSDTQGYVANPAGSDGILCLGGAAGRFIAPGQVKSTGSSGAVTLDSALGEWSPLELPWLQGSPSIPALPYSLASFQFWHRDSVGGVATSNFTSGYSVFWH